MRPSLVTPLVVAAQRCLKEPASRVLDARIHCAVLGVKHGTGEGRLMIEARSRGMILVTGPGLLGWIDVPRYTADLCCAQSLLPEGLTAISRDPLTVCATALLAIAMAQAPALPSDEWLA